MIELEIRKEITSAMNQAIRAILDNSKRRVEECNFTLEMDWHELHFAFESLIDEEKSQGRKID